jgi:hypothetical protein
MSDLKPFDFVDAVGHSKKDLIRSSDDPEGAEKQYSPWLANLAFSLHVDTILYANDANRLADLPNRMQHDYYLHSLRSKKRYGKWPKKGDRAAEEAVQWRYRINRQRAVEALRVLRPEEVENIIKEHQNATGEQGGHLQRVRR